MSKNKQKNAILIENEKVDKRQEEIHQIFIKALKTVDTPICKKCGQKLPEDWDEYEARYA